MKIVITKRTKHSIFGIYSEFMSFVHMFFEFDNEIFIDWSKDQIFGSKFTHWIYCLQVVDLIGVFYKDFVITNNKFKDLVQNFILFGDVRNYSMIESDKSFIKFF